MTPKEALERVAILSEILVDVSKFHIMPNEAINEIRKLGVAEIYFLLGKQIKELEELKRDVKRYFELRNHEDFPFAFGSELSVEVYRLREKLMEVGNEE